ncbi:MAG: hypothetical protein ACRC8C_02760 [Mycoplasmoidaceae bacterium]
MKNKKLKKAVLTSFSIFSFTGIVLATNLDNISKLQASFSNEYSLNDGFNPANETFGILSNDVPKSNIESRAATTITLNSGIEFDSIVAGTYPFQIVNNRETLDKLITVNNTPPGFNPLTDITYSVLGVKNTGATSESGEADITVSVRTYFDIDGVIQRPGPAYPGALERPFAIRKFKSETNQTTYDKLDSFIPVGRYASDVVNGTIPIANVLGIKNGVANLSSSQNTVVDVVSLRFNNIIGELNVDYTLQNFFDGNGAYITNKSRVFNTNIPTFKLVPGPTFVGLREGIIGNTLIPSTIAQQLELDVLNYTSWFSLNNVPDEGATISAINNIVPNDKDGTISFTYKIDGNYFDSQNVLQTAPSGGFDITTTITGLNSQPETVDTIPIIIGASVGGVVLIAIIALTIFFVSKSKKKKNENLRKQKLSEKVSPPTGGFSKTATTTAPSSNSVPGGPPKSPTGPPTPGNRPVPPPARK